MRRLRCMIFAATALLLMANGRMASAQRFISPTVDLATPTISFDANINPVAGAYSTDALNIIRAHEVALQQVQAALQYLRIHRLEIMEGKNAWYNQVFGDFYNPNSAFAGLYSRTKQIGELDSHGKPILDHFGHQVTQTEYNTSHFDQVFTVFLHIQAALNEKTTYSWGAQPSNAANQAVFNTYRTANPALGDPLFGNATITSTEDRGTRQWGDSTSFTPAHLAQINSNPNSPLAWDLDNAVGGTLTPAQELAFFKDRLDAYSVSTTTAGSGTSGSTTSVDTYVGGAFLNELMRSDSSNPGQPNPFFIPTELNQYQQIIAALAQSAGSLGYDLVTIETVTTRTDTSSGSSGSSSSSSSSTSNTTTSTSDTTVQGVTTNSSAFKAGTTTTTSTSTQTSGTGSSNSGSNTGSNSGGSNQTVTTTITTVTTVTITHEGGNIEPGLVKLFGQSAYFMAALDSNSYAQFVDRFKPTSEGGVGDGTLLPPPGKQGTHSSSFFPIVPGS